MGIVKTLFFLKKLGVILMEFVYVCFTLITESSFEFKA